MTTGWGGVNLTARRGGWRMTAVWRGGPPARIEDDRWAVREQAVRANRHCNKLQELNIYYAITRHASLKLHDMMHRQKYDQCPALTTSRKNYSDKTGWLKTFVSFSMYLQRNAHLLKNLCKSIKRYFRAPFFSYLYFFIKTIKQSVPNSQKYFKF